VKTPPQDFPTTALTFEAWLSTSDLCHAGTVLSYAHASTSADPARATADSNAFVIFDPRNLLACRDFQYIDLAPDPAGESCHAAYRCAAARAREQRRALRRRRLCRPLRCRPPDLHCHFLR